MVFRFLSGLPIEHIWDITDEGAKLEFATPLEILYGAAFGLVGGLVAAGYASFHWKVMGLFRRFDLLDNRRAVYRAWVGAVVVVLLGMLIPVRLIEREQRISRFSCHFLITFPFL